MRIPTKGLGIDSVIAWAKDLAAIELLGGRLLEAVEVTTTDAELEHGLGRVMRGALIVGSDVAQAYKLTEFTSLHYTISAGSESTVSLWVF